MRDTFGFEVTESINTVNSLMAAFGITSEQAYTLLAQGAQQGANKNGDLIDVINEYAPHFAQLGLSAEEFTDTLIQGAASGAFQIDKVGDAIKEFGIRAKDGSDTSAAGFKALGLNAEKMFEAFAKGGPGAEKAFQEVIKSLGDMKDPLAQNQAGVALFGTMFEDLGVDAIKALGDIEDYAKADANTLALINAVKYDDIGAALEGLKRQLITDLAGPIGDELTPRIGEMIEKVKEFNMAPVIDALTWILDNAGTIAALAVGIGAGMATWNVVTTIQAVVQAVKTWQAATQGASIAQAALNLVLEANPIGIVITAIAALVAGLIVLWNTNEDFREAVTEIWKSITEVITYAVDKVVKFFTVSIPSAFNSALMAMKTWILNLIITANNELPRVMETILTFFMELPGDIFDIGVDIVRGLWEGVNSMVSWLENKVRSFARGILNSMKDALGIHSPSRVMRDEVGLMVGAGMAEGIDKSILDVQSAMSRLNRNLVAEAQISTKTNDGVGNPAIRGVSSGRGGTTIIKVINQGTIVGSGGMSEFAKMVSREIGGAFGLSTGGAF